MIQFYDMFVNNGFGRYGCMSIMYLLSDLLHINKLKKAVVSIHCSLPPP